MEDSAQPLGNKFDFKKMEEFYAKTGNHTNNLCSNVNLLDFEFDKKPTKVNILELSPLHGSKKEVEEQMQKIDLKENGKNEQLNENAFCDSKTKENDKTFENKSNFEKKNQNDINDLFENIKMFEPPKETSKIDKFKEIYNSQFTENEASKIDKIYNLFGGPSFSFEVQSAKNSLKFSPIPSTNMTKRNSNSNLPTDFSLKEEKRNSTDPSSSTHKYVCNLYPKFEELPFKKTPFDEKPSPQSNQSDQTKKKDLFDLFN